MRFEVLISSLSVQTIQHGEEGYAMALRTDLQTGEEEILRFSPGCTEEYPSSCELYRAGDLLRHLHEGAVREGREARAAWKV